MISKSQVKDIRKKVQSALDAAGDDLGMVFTLGVISYGDNDFKSRIEARYKDSIPKVCEDYDSIYSELDLPPRDTIIEFDDGLYQIYGFKRLATKRPVIIKNMSGDEFVISIKSCYQSSILGE